MVNAKAVNAGPRYFSPPSFCVFFRDLGRILDSKNPVKYTRRPEVNGRNRPRRRPLASAQQKYRTKSTPYVAHLVNANVRRKRLRSSPWQRQSRERQKRPLPLRTAKQRLPGPADCDPATDAVPEPGLPRQPKAASRSRRGRWGKVYTFDGRYYSLAPAWRSMSASSGRLYFRAIDSAVLPSRVFAFTLAPAASSARVTSMRPA